MKKVRAKLLLTQLINRSMVSQSPIAVVGAGSWGTALAIHLARNGNNVRLWGRDTEALQQVQQSGINSKYLPNINLPENLAICLDYHECLEPVDDVLLVVPSSAFRQALNDLYSLQKNNIRIVWGTKGLDPLSNALLSDVASEIFSKEIPMAVLSGPSFAMEVARQCPTALSMASTDEQFASDLMARLHSHYFRVYQNDDLVGVQLCGAVKNVMAIAVGIADGLLHSANSRSAMITRGLAELSRLCTALGGLQKTMLSLAGVGDLVLTCTDDQSRNRRFGLAIGRGKQIDQALTDIGQVVEGVENARQVFQLAQQHMIDMPLVEQVYRVLHDGISAKQALENLLSRQPARE